MYTQTGMLKTLLKHPEIAHQATLEIIADIYFLSQCSTLIGISASQVFRMAVAMSNVTGVFSVQAIRCVCPCDNLCSALIMHNYCNKCLTNFIVTSP